AKKPLPRCCQRTRALCRHSSGSLTQTREGSSVRAIVILESHLDPCLIPLVISKRGLAQKSATWLLVPAEPVHQAGDPGVEAAVVRFALRWLSAVDEDLRDGVGAAPGGELAGGRIDFRLDDACRRLPAPVAVQAGLSGDLRPDRQRQRRP